MKNSFKMMGFRLRAYIADGRHSHPTRLKIQSAIQTGLLQTMQLVTKDAVPCRIG